MLILDVHKLASRLVNDALVFRLNNLLNFPLFQTPKFVFSDITTGQEVGMTLEHTRQQLTESECGPGQTSVNPDVW